MGQHRRQDDEDRHLADQIRAVERERLRMLVAKEIDAARALHADDFQLVTPSGNTYTRDGYLGAIASGAINYVSWDPGEIAVRLYDDAAVIRYQSTMEVVTARGTYPPGPVWHTDAYELRDGRWQIVWSQATNVR